MDNDKLQRPMTALTKPSAGILGAAALAAFAALAAIGSPGDSGTNTSAAPAGANGVVISQAMAENAKPAPAAASTMTDAQRLEIEGIIRNYLVKNPEILIEISRELERKQAEAKAGEHKELIVENKAKLFRSDLDYVYGNEKGDITVIEFFDYNCGWCKRALDQVQQLVDKDTNVRVVMKEYPIFGEHSEFAARAAMAAKLQGKYWEYHVALMKEQRVTSESALKTAAEVGLDVERLKKDMADPKFADAIKDTSQLAGALGIEGTPGFIIDTKVQVGYVPVDGLQELIGAARKAGCQTC